MKAAITTAPVAERQEDRVRTRIPVSYGVGVIDRSSFAESISPAGLYIRTNRVFRVGTRLVLRIQFPERAICHRGEVTWAIRVPDAQHARLVCGMGVALVDIDPEWPEFFSRWRARIAV